MRRRRKFGAGGRLYFNVFIPSVHTGCPATSGAAGMLQHCRAFRILVVNQWLSTNECVGRVRRLGSSTSHAGNYHILT